MKAAIIMCITVGSFLVALGVGSQITKELTRYASLANVERQEVLDLPISTHTDSLRDGMWNTIWATPTNTSWVVRMETRDIRESSTNKNYQIVFGVQIYSEFKSTDWFAMIPPSKPIATTYSSNVIARIVWKGQTNECVLERNQ
jgi:hypothetical protein